MDCPSRDTLARLPLAEAVLTLWNWTMNPEFLQQIWDEGRGRCYDREISFDVMVQLIADALLEKGGSGRKAFECGIEQAELTASIQAAYQKLGRLPVKVSQSFLRDCTIRLRMVFPEWAEFKVPRSIHGFRVRVVDGKALKNVAKRLKPLQRTKGGLLAGRFLASLDWNSGMVVGMVACEDGEANEKKLTGDLVTATETLDHEPILWVADSAFSDLTQPSHFARNGNYFLTRYHAGVPFFIDSDMQPVHRVDELGRKVHETWGWLGSPSNSKRIYVRRIEVTKDDGKPLILITNLIDSKFSSIDLLWLYRERWSIEQVYQKITEVFGLQHLIGSTPKACIFQASFCMVLYNMMQAIRGFIAQSQDIEPEELSTEKLFEDVKDQLIAWNLMIDLWITKVYFEASCTTASQVQSRLRKILGKPWRDRWRKTPWNKRNLRLPDKPKPPSGHSSVYRLIRDASSKQKTKTPSQSHR